MVNAPCSAVNCALTAPMQSAGVDETYQRIVGRVAQLPDGAGREVAWLADKLDTSQQRVYNWKTRGVPASALAGIAAALGWTVDQVLGLKAPPSEWPFETIAAARWAALNPHQRAMVELAARLELERIEGFNGKLHRPAA